MRGRLGILGAGCLLLNGCAGLGVNGFNMPALFGYSGPTRIMQEASPGDYMQHTGAYHSKGFHPIELCRVIQKAPDTLCD